MKRILISLFSLIPVLLFSQIKGIDSLLHELNRPDDTVKINTLINIYTKYENGKITEGKKYLDLADTIAKDLKNEKMQALIYLDYGKYFNIIGEFDNSLQYLNKAKEYFQAHNAKKKLASALNNMGVTHEKMGNYNEALESYIDCLTIYETINDSAGLAKTYLNLGLLYYRQNDFKKCGEYYNKSLELKIKLKDKEGTALVYNNLGILNYYLEDYDNVSNYFEKAYKTYRELGNLRQQAMALANLAEIYNIIGQKDKSLKYYFEALKIEQDLENKNDQISTLLLISQVYLSRFDYTNALKYSYEGLAIAKETKSKPELSDCYSTLYQINKELKNYPKALNYFELHKLYQDSLFSETKTKQLTELQTKYETKKKEQLITNLENEKLINSLKIKRQQNFSITLLSGFLLIFLFFLILFKQNKKIRFANRLLSYQKKQITDSIEYASLIQSAVLPSSEFISSIFPEHFILYKPRDIVSGDFYWFKEKNGSYILAVADCTGHGVPGALLSMMGISFLNDIVANSIDINVSKILDELRQNVKLALGQFSSRNLRKEGIEIGLLCYNPEQRSISFSGAHLSLWLNRNDILKEFKSDGMSIGISLKEKPFTSTVFKIEKGDTIYMFTDGFADQIGGPNGKKLLRRNLLHEITKITSLPLTEQNKILERIHFEWKENNYDQIDDILVLGVKF